LVAGSGGKLTDRNEAQREEPWGVADAPGDYIEGQLRAVVELKFRSHLLGKWKVARGPGGSRAFKGVA
jgi:transcriptional regulator